MTATPRLSNQRRLNLADFYAAQQRSLAQRVRREVHGVDDLTLEDACGHAWLQLTRRTDVSLDRRGLAWLTRVAVYEAWRLCRPSGALVVEGPNAPTGTLAAADDPLERALDAAAHRERVARFATLKPRERRDLLLLAGGYHYREIARLTASTYSAVNRRITEGRRRLYASESSCA